jgi:hypothetical protein
LTPDGQQDRVLEYCQRDTLILFPLIQLLAGA